MRIYTKRIYAIWMLKNHETLLDYKLVYSDSRKIEIILNFSLFSVTETAVQYIYPVIPTYT